MNIRSVFVVALVTGLLAATAAWSGSRALTAAPTAVAVVDLERLFQSLDESKKRGEDLKKKYEPRQAELVKLGEQIQERKAALEKIPNNEQNRPRREDLQIEIAVYEQMHKNKRDLVQQQVYLDRGDDLKAMYPKVIEACKYVATQDGWDLVIVDDSSVDLPQGRSSEQNVMGAITMRRVLHKGARLDVTDQVAQKLNSDFGNGR